MEFKVEIFQALKSLENDLRYGKVWKSLENCEADPDNLGFHYTVDYSSICLLLCLHFMSQWNLVFFSNFEPIWYLWYLEIYNEVILHRLSTPFAV